MVFRESRKIFRAFPLLNVIARILTADIPPRILFLIRISQDTKISIQRLILYDSQGELRLREMRDAL